MIKSSPPEVGGHEPDSDPRCVVVEALPAEHPLGADAHHEVRGDPGEQQRAKSKPGDRRRARRPRTASASTSTATATTSEAITSIAPATCTNSGRSQLSAGSMSAVMRPASRSCRSEAARTASRRQHVHHQRRPLAARLGQLAIPGGELAAERPGDQPQHDRPDDPAAPQAGSRRRRTPARSRTRSPARCRRPTGRRRTRSAAAAIPSPRTAPRRGRARPPGQTRSARGERAACGTRWGDHKPSTGNSHVA